MGLDNGIILKPVPKKIPFFVTNYFVWDTKEGTDIELVYFRKQWGIRNEILSALTDNFTDEYRINLTPDNITSIIKILYKYLNKNYYNSNGNLNWEYTNMIKPLISYIINLYWLRNYLIKNKNVECYFYDSY